MSTPYNTDLVDEQLVPGSLWLPEFMLACLRRDWGAIERPFHLYVASTTRTLSSTSFVGFPTTTGQLTLHTITGIDFVDTGVSLTWRIGIPMVITTSGAEVAEVRLTATNATNHGTYNTGSGSGTLWVEGTTWPPVGLAFQARKTNGGDPNFDVTISRAWTANSANCYLQIDEV